MAGVPPALAYAIAAQTPAIPYADALNASLTRSSPRTRSTRPSAAAAINPAGAGPNRAAAATRTQAEKVKFVLAPSPRSATARVSPKPAVAAKAIHSQAGPCAAGTRVTAATAEQAA